MSIDDHTIKPRERETIDELLSLQSQFTLLAGFIEGLTFDMAADSDRVRPGGIAELRQLLHGMAFYKKMLAGRVVRVVDK